MYDILADYYFPKVEKHITLKNRQDYFRTFGYYLRTSYLYLYYCSYQVRCTSVRDRVLYLLAW